MVSTSSDRWKQVKNRTMPLHVVIRRSHRVIAVLWLLSLVLPLAISLPGGEVPGPGLTAMLLYALIITGSYLLIRPWVRMTGTISDRLKRLKDWNVPRSLIIRRSHRIIAALWVPIYALGVVLNNTGGPVTLLIGIPAIVLLILLIITGGYMFLRPWVNRVRAR